MPKPSRPSRLIAPAFAALATLLSPGPAPARDLPAAIAGAEACAVADSVTGHLLLARNANRKMAVGSLTNVATAMIVLDWLDYRKKDVSELVTMQQEVAMFSQNPIGFAPGDQVTIRDLLYAALMQSDDIAADALAWHVGEDLTPSSANETPIQRFVAQMNALARKLGMRNTRFVNPSGLDTDERPLPFSTAADMALLGRYAMNRSQFRFYVSQRTREITVNHPLAGAAPYELQNTNELVGVDSIDGIKTGTTRRSGPCLLLSAARPPESVQQGAAYIITPRRLIVAALGAPDRFGTGRALLESGWQAYDDWAARGRPPGRQ